MKKTEKRKNTHKFCIRNLRLYQTNILENVEAIKKDGVFYISKLAIEAFVTDVKNGKFPSDQFSYKNN